MESEHQLTFVTDDELARRLRQLENQLLDWQARVPSMLREVVAIRRLLDPRDETAPPRGA